jgi:AcrR family transcriptional regulator
LSTQAGADGTSGAVSRGPDPRAVRSRAAAIAAAQELMAEHGWSAVTHVAVATRSGVGRTTLYRHWPNATSLIHDAIADRMSLVRTERTGELRTDLVSELNGLRLLLHEPVTERGMRACIERAGVDAAFTELKESLYRAGTAGFRAILRGATERGELPAGLNLDLAIDHLAGPLFFRRLLAGRTFDGEYVAGVVEAFLHGHAPLRAAEPPPG